MKKKEETAGEIMPHLLALDEVTPMRSWGEFVRAWNLTTIAEMRHGLLHFGFDVPIDPYDLETRRFRILFYLEIADGWNDFGAKRFGESSEKTESSFGRLFDAEVRKRIARRAFELLCLRFFKNKTEGIGMPSWAPALVGDEELTRVVLDFLLENRVARSTDDHHAVIFHRFIDDFVRLAWWPSWGGMFERYRGPLPTGLDFRKYGEFLKSIRPDLVRLLHRSGSISNLLNVQYEVDEETVVALREIALEDSWVREPRAIDSRKPETVDEAIYAGSMTALVFHACEIRLAEGIRLQQVAEAKRAREEADRRLEKLGATGK